MTATLVELRPSPLYPQTFGGFPACAECFQRTDDLAVSGDPRDDADGPLTLLCRACYQALVIGRPITLPTGQALIDTWDRVARQYINGEIAIKLAHRAVDNLARDVEWTTRNAAWEQLYEAYRRLAGIRSDDFDPADGDRDYLEGEADRDRENALRKLTGAQR